MDIGFFFDSHGGLHSPCSPSEEGAGDFGPTGVSRAASLREALLDEDYARSSGSTDYARAESIGAVARVGEWDILVWPTR